MPDLWDEARPQERRKVMRRARSILLAASLSAAACAPTTLDSRALRSAAMSRQSDGSRSPPAKDVQELLGRPLTAESAAAVALLNNHGVRAEIEELGIAEGRLTQARRLPNPTVEGAMRFEGEGRPELEVGAMIDITDLLLLASRSSAARAEVDAARLSAIGSILDLSYDTRRAFYVYQAAAELLELRRTVLQSFDASSDLATRLREAGNITELDLASQRSSFEEARLEFQEAEVGLTAARERLNGLMGLWGKGTGWHATPRLPDVPAQELELETLESTAIGRSLDLVIAKNRFGAAAKRANLARAQGFLPELKAGVSAERQEEWSVGPAIEVEVPLFYQGQGEVGVARAQMRQQQELYTDVAVTLRASARNAASRLSAKREAVLFYKTSLLPLKQKIVEQTQLEYNAMLVGLFQLLQAKRDQVRTAAAYVEQHREYWIARTNAEQLLAGRRHPEELTRTITPGAGTPGGAQDLH
jgi:cobalt-zinc-cadmium efflux system outer membrane protein